MTHPLDIIESIANAKTVVDKEAIIIADATDNALLKRVVHMALDTSLSFHIKALEFVPPKASLFGMDSEAATIETVMDMLEVLNRNGSCDGYAKSRINAAYSTLSVADRKLIDIILSRKVSCGAGLPKWRKAYGDEFLPDWPCYLSSAFDEAKILEHIFANNPYAWSEVKSDGQRCEALIKKDGIKMHSRNGKQYHGLNALERALHNLEWDKDRFGEEVVIDGELVLLDDDGNIVPRSIGNGKIGKAIKGTMTREVASKVLFVIWDIIPMKEFTGEIPLGDARKIMHCDRIFELTCMMDVHGESYPDCDKLRVQKGRKVKNVGEAMEHYAELVGLEEEGSILKNIYGDWEPCPNKKRPLSQFKFKEEFEADFIITGWYYGEKGKKYENAIGGFYIESSCGMVKSKCGGGISDEIRFDKNPDKFTGMIANIKYNARSMAVGRDTFSLTHPRMEELCEDKVSADSLERIIEQEEATREMKRCMGQGK